jgi:hypothetical protein
VDDDGRADERPQRPDRDQSKCLPPGTADAVEVEVKRALEDDDRDAQPDDRLERVAENRRIDQAQSLGADDDARDDQKHDARDSESVREHLGSDTNAHDRHDDLDDVDRSTHRVPPPKCRGSYTRL